MSFVCVTFVKADGSEVSVETETGVTVLQLAQEQGIDIEGACEGNMACSTCHVILDKDHFNKLCPASEEEEEMLDLAAGLKATSRLGCQLMVDESLNGARLTLPKITKNILGL
tara:strand:+ start:1075 stop:1413 length:339 start_codon:yes stop_codon:yes gene_type:complete